MKRRSAGLGLALLALLLVAACRGKSVPAATAPVASAPPPRTPAAAPSTSAAEAKRPHDEGPSADSASTAPPDSSDAGNVGGGRGGMVDSHGRRYGGSPALSNPRATVSDGSLTVTGHLGPELIARVSRTNFLRYRLCYEDGLRKNPRLEGHVSVKFVIDADGHVTSASDDGSELPDKKVVACVVSGVSNLTFPKPESGDATVVLRLMFSPR